MKILWKKKSKKRSVPTLPSGLPFNQQDEDEDDPSALPSTTKTIFSSQSQQNCDLELADSFLSQGNKLAEDRRFQEALGKWEAALTLVPDRAVIHEQKAQVLLEIGDAWGALKAASRATELEPSWAEAWITLARAQLNFGEPESSIESFDKALKIKPDSKEALEDKETALHLVKKRKRLQISGLDAAEGRFVVGDKVETS